MGRIPWPPSRTRRIIRVMASISSTSDAAKRLCGSRAGRSPARQRERISFAATTRAASSFRRRGSRRSPTASRPPPARRERLSPTPPRLCARPVIRLRQSAVSSAPRAHRLTHELARPAPLDRAGMAGFAVGVGVALAVARLRVRAASAANALVARLDGARLLTGVPPGLVAGRYGLHASPAWVRPRRQSGDRVRRPRLPARLRICGFCADVIGVYEPLILAGAAVHRRASQAAEPHRSPPPMRAITGLASSFGELDDAR
jgi:hypothetical protein